MSETQQLEMRLAALEREFADFKQKQASNGSGQNWLQRMLGSFQNDPEFDEIVRLGREYRQSQTFESHG